MGLNKTNFFLAIWALLLLTVWVETASKYTDENRPYEFGFSIEGEQHRHEKKDEKGIITGEFGFITGDGVYHVTVYATDENGNFKIISMKSIKVSPALDGSEGPLPAKPALKPATGSIPSAIGSITPVGQQPITQPPVISTVLTTTSKPASTLTVFTTAKPLNVPACSSCAIPSTTKRPPGLKPGELNFQTPGFSKIPQQQNKPNQFTPQQPQNKFPIQQNPNPQQQNPPRNPFIQQQNPPKNPLPIQQQNPPRNPFSQQQNPSPNLVQNPPANQFSVQNPQKNPVSELNTELVGPLFPGLVPNQDISQPDRPIEPHPGLPPPILPNYPDFEVPSPQKPPGSPVPSVPNLKPSSPNTNKVSNLSKPVKKPAFFPGLIHPPPSGQNPPVEGKLPPGVTSDDMLQLLYRFNYTVGFHGHYETGYKNGAKIGGYFVNGRDGISRIVEYTADENGYRPKVTFINLGLNSPDTPKEETEKDFGLKNYVFEWFSL